MAWFKFDAGFFSNRKVIRAGRDGRDVYQHVLCCNALRNADGEVPAGDVEPWYVARQMGITPDEASQGLAAAIAAGLLVTRGNAIAIVGWDPSWSTQRQSRADIQRNYRERKKKEQEAQNSVTGEVTRYHDRDALPDRSIDRSRERGNAQDSLSASLDLDSEAATRESQGDHRRQGRRFPLPSDWRPDNESADLAGRLGLNVQHEAEQFMSHFKAKPESIADWQERFRKWLRDEVAYRGRRGQPITKRARKPGAVRAEAAQLADDYGDPIREGT